jgi:hypothetical protein
MTPPAHPGTMARPPDEALAETPAPRADVAPLPVTDGTAPLVHHLRELVAITRFLARLPGFLRRPLGPGEARRILGQRLAARERDFLDLGATHSLRSRRQSVPRAAGGSRMRVRGSRGPRDPRGAGGRAPGDRERGRVPDARRAPRTAPHRARSDRARRGPRTVRQSAHPAALRHSQQRQPWACRRARHQPRLRAGRGGGLRPGDRRPRRARLVPRDLGGPGRRGAEAPSDRRAGSSPSTPARTCSPVPGDSSRPAAGGTSP